MTDSKFPTLAEWKAPWEDKGEEIDADKVKAFVYAEKKRAHDLEAELKVSKAEVKAKSKTIAGLEDEKAKREQENESAADKAKREAEEKAKADAESAAAISAATRENALLKVRLETGLNENQAKRLIGDDFEALLADAESYIKENGLGEEEEEEVNPLVREPKAKKIQPGDPDPKKPRELTGEEIAAEFMAGRTSLF